MILVKNSTAILMVMMTTTIIFNMLHDAELVWSFIFFPIALAFFILTLCAFLYPSFHSQISNQVPGIALSTESNHTHTFSCTEAGSSFVAKYVASLIKNQLLCSGL